MLALFTDYEQSSLAVWMSSNDGTHIINVTLRQAQLVLRWVTNRGYNVLVCNQSSRPTQSPTLSGMGHEFRPKCGNPPQLGSKGSALIDKRVADR